MEEFDQHAASGNVYVPSALEIILMQSNAESLRTTKLFRFSVMVVRNCNTYLRNICKRYLRLAAVAMIVTCLAGCTKDNANDDAGQNADTNGKVTIMASIASDWRTPETKVGLEDEDTQGVRLAWVAGDVIAMYDAAGRLAATFALDQQSNGLRSGTFTLVSGSVRDDERYTAVYPADESRTLAGRRRTVGMVAQSGPQSPAHLNDVCYMKADYTHTTGNMVSFDLEFAMLTVIIAPPPDYIAVNHGEPRSLTVINGDNQNTALIGGVEDLSSSIKVYMLIDPTAETNRTITFQLICGNGNGNHVFTRSIENISRAYEAGKRYTANLSGENELNLVSGWPLADFAPTNVPAGDTWVVSDALGSADAITDIYGLRDALREVYNADNGRRINLVIPDATGVPGIATGGSSDNAPFYGCDALSSVTLPVATRIGQAAFARCSNIKTINLPNAGIIEASAFTYCNSIEFVSLPSAIDIGEGAFQNCRNLSSVDLPKAVTTHIYAFLDCPSLASVNMPEATTIEGSTFYYCSVLSSASLPAARIIGNNVFYRCSSLTSANLPSAISLGNGVFAGCSTLSEVEIATSSPGLVSTPANLFENANPVGDITLTIGAAESEIAGVDTDLENNMWRGYGPFKAINVQ